MSILGKPCSCLPMALLVLLRAPGYISNDFNASAMTRKTLALPNVRLNSLKVPNQPSTYDSLLCSTHPLSGCAWLTATRIHGRIVGKLSILIPSFQRFPASSFPAVTSTLYLSNQRNRQMTRVTVIITPPLETSKAQFPCHLPSRTRYHPTMSRTVIPRWNASKERQKLAVNLASLGVPAPTFNARVASRTAWFSGTLITLFSELRLERARHRFGANVYHLPTTFMTDIGALMVAIKFGMEDKKEKLTAAVIQAFKNVRAKYLIVLAVLLTYK